VTEKIEGEFALLLDIDITASPSSNLYVDLKIIPQIKIINY
jgi:hypothetical protein